MKEHKIGEELSFNGLKEAMVEALFEEDFATFKGCIAIIIDSFDYQLVTKKTGLSKSTLYRMCEPNSNPTLKNISKIMHFLKKQKDFAA